MTKKELADILKYSSPHVLYIVTWNNLLKKLYCPFKILVINPIGDLAKGELHIVEMVKVDMNLKTIYVINGKAYYYYHFEIIE